MTRVPSDNSFRDPHGNVFVKNGCIFRSIESSYFQHYQTLMDSGLYKVLTEREILVEHKEVSRNRNKPYWIIKPHQIPFISYPYEWCFSQLKSAAMTMLTIEKFALAHNMTLKDASAYNIQFVGLKPLLIDTLSFIPYKNNSPWVGYRQFCMQFLAPLLLMSTVDHSLHSVLLAYPDGVPLHLASRLLPRRSYGSVLAFTHIHLQGWLATNQLYRKRAKQEWDMPKRNLLALIENLLSSIERIKPPYGRGHWKQYYDTLSYSPSAFEAKQRIVTQMLRRIPGKTALDIGANTGIFSTLCISQGFYTIAIDNDPYCIEALHSSVPTANSSTLLPLCVDVAHPSPSLGWANKERNSFIARGPFDVLLGLAVIHHLRITNGIPFSKQAETFSTLCKYCIIEYIPKDDVRVQEMLLNRDDVYTDYSENAFISVFKKFFTIQQRVPIPASQRVLYIMKNKHRI